MSSSSRKHTASAAVTVQVTGAIVFEVLENFVFASWLYIRYALASTKHKRGVVARDGNFTTSSQGGENTLAHLIFRAQRENQEQNSSRSQVYAHSSSVNNIEMQRKKEPSRRISSDNTSNTLAKNPTENPQPKAIVYQITTGTIQGQISVNDQGVVIAATLSLRHLEGRLLPNVENWLKSNHGVMEKICRPAD